MTAFWQDLRYALRSFRNRPTFAAVAILTIAIGIGANTTIFSSLRSLVLNPAALLLDEPTANLDPYNVGLIEEIIRGHGSTTMVLVTHNTFQAKRLADRVGLLLGGKLIELLPMDQFFNDPIDPRTRSFINGEMVY